MPRRLKITDAHLSPLAEEQVRRFEDEMVIYLRREYRTVLARREDGWVYELIREGTKQAREYGIVLERDVARYLELMLSLSPDFDDNEKTPWCGDVLAENIPAQGKLDRIWEHLIFDDEPTASNEKKNPRPRDLPKPFRPAVVAETDRRFQSDYSDLTRGMLGMDPQDATYRGSWVAAYHDALEDLDVQSATSRPLAEVGAPILGHQAPPTGTLTIVIVDAVCDQPLAGASVQVSGPSTELAVADHTGGARFENLAIGEYELLAMDAQHRMGRSTVTVKRGETELRVPCRRVGGPP